MATERDEAARRHWWADMVGQGDHQYVFLDETSANVTLICSLAFSPDVNPIAQAVSTRKAALRRAQARIQEAFEAAIAATVDTITVTDAAYFSTHIGFDLSTGQPLSDVLIGGMKSI